MRRKQADNLWTFSFLMPSMTIGNLKEDPQSVWNYNSQIEKRKKNFQSNKLYNTTFWHVH